eukprot:gene10883-11037_t
MDAALSRIVKVEEAAAEQLQQLSKDFANIHKQHCAAREKLYKRRQELVSGKSVPSPEELHGFDIPSLASPTSHAAAPVKGVPYFWLNVLCNQDTIAEEVTVRDKQALAYCTGVRAVLPAGDDPPTVEFSFCGNPFFSNSVLRRCLGDDEADIPEMTTDIQWKDTAHKLVVKEVAKKGGGSSKKSKKGKSGKGTASDDLIVSSSTVKIKPCPSFFRFFLPDSNSKHSKPASRLHDLTAVEQDDDGDWDEYEDEEGLQLHEVPTKSAKTQHDELLMAVLLREVLPQATTLYLAGPLQVNAWAILFPPSTSQPAVPRFWLRVLRSADAAALAISARDAALLACLADVRFSLHSNGSSGESSSIMKELHGKLEMEFEQCKHLASGCNHLKKEYSFEVGASGEPFLLSSRIAAAPQWTSAVMDPTHKQGRDGKTRPASSFFQLFRSGGGKYAFNLAGDDKDVQSEANELEVEMLMELETQLLLQAGSIYRQGAVDGWPDDDTPAGDEAAWSAAAQAATEAEEEEEEDSDKDSEAGDDGEAAHKAAAKRSKAKAAGFKLTKASVLVAFVVLILFAELFVFLDMAGLLGGK